MASIASRTPLVSGWRLEVTPTSVASDSNSTHEPAAVRLGAALAPLPGAPPGVVEASRTCGRPVPLGTSAFAICATPPVRTRSPAVVENATMLPSTLFAGWVDGPEPARPLEPTETSFVSMRRYWTLRPLIFLP